MAPAREPVLSLNFKKLGRKGWQARFFFALCRGLIYHSPKSL
jgi:hypothetical protein